MAKSIYPSIPSPGNDASSMRASIDAMRQTMTMLIMNAQHPSPNFTPSSAAQVFVTKEELKNAISGVSTNGATNNAVTVLTQEAQETQEVQSTRSLGLGIPEAPMDGGKYVRQNGEWVPV
jgi:hypothetical protein